MNILRHHLTHNGDPKANYVPVAMTGDVEHDGRGTVLIRQGSALAAFGFALSTKHVDPEVVQMDVMVEAAPADGMYRRERWTVSK